MVGNVAIQQALRIVFRLPYRKVASVMGVHHRTAWQHVAARPGSNVRAWDSRTNDEKKEATKEAKRLLNGE